MTNRHIKRLSPLRLNNYLKISIKKIPILSYTNDRMTIVELAD